eukprot:97166_1
MPRNGFYLEVFCTFLSLFYVYANAVNECIDFAEWTIPYTNLNLKGYASLLCTDSTNIYIVGGGSNGGNKAWTYNLTDNSIYQRGTVTSLLLWYPNLSAGLGNFFYFSRTNPSNYPDEYSINNFWAFNMLNGTLDKIGTTYPKPQKIGQECYTSDDINGFLYIMGGTKNQYTNGGTSYFSIFNTNTNTWISGPNLNHARYGSACTYSPIDQKVYVFGGQMATSKMETFDTHLWNLNTTWNQSVMPYSFSHTSAFISQLSRNQIFIIKPSHCYKYIINIPYMVKCGSNAPAMAGTNSLYPSQIFLPEIDMFYFLSGSSNIYASQLQQKSTEINIAALNPITFFTQSNVAITVNVALLCDDFQNVYISLMSTELNIDSILVLKGVDTEIISCFICDKYNETCNNCSYGWLSQFPNQLNIPMVHHDTYWIQSSISGNYNINYNVIPGFNVTIDANSVMFNLSLSSTTIYPWQPIPIILSSFFLPSFTSYQLNITSINKTLQLSNTVLNIATNNDSIEVCNVCYDTNHCNNCSYGMLSQFEGQIVIPKDSNANTFYVDASLISMNTSATITGFTTIINPFVNISAALSSIIYPKESIVYIPIDLNFILFANEQYQFNLTSTNKAFVISHTLNIVTNDEQMIECEICVDNTYCNECNYGLLVDQVHTVVTEGTNHIEFWVNVTNANENISVFNNGFYVRTTTFKNIFSTSTSTNVPTLKTTISMFPATTMSPATNVSESKNVPRNNKINTSITIVLVTISIIITAVFICGLFFYNRKKLTHRLKSLKMNDNNYHERLLQYEQPGSVVAGNVTMGNICINNNNNKYKSVKSHNNNNDIIAVINNTADGFSTDNRILIDGNTADIKNVNYFIGQRLIIQVQKLLNVEATIIDIIDNEQFIVIEYDYYNNKGTEKLHVINDAYRIKQILEEEKNDIEEDTYDKNNNNNEGELEESLIRNENENNEYNECVVCMDKTPKYICIPCGHYCVCSKCKDVVNNKCPMCQANCTFFKVFK